MFATLHDDRLGRGGHPDRVRARALRSMRRVTIACSSRSLSERSSCSPEVVVDGGVGARRVEPASATVLAALALAPHEQLGARGEERRVAARRRRTRSSRGTPRAARRCTAAGSCGRGAWHLDLAREHDLLEPPGADPLDGRARRPAS